MKRIFPSRSYNLRIVFGFVFCSLGLLLALVGFALSSVAGITPAGTAAKIAPQVLADTAGRQNAAVVILLAEQADVSAAYDMKDQDARGRFVYQTLTRHASRTQAALRAFLEARGVNYQSFWAANMIVTSADRVLVEELAARGDVARVDSNNPTRWIEDPEIANFTPSDPAASNVVEWGVQNVNAPAVWSLGFTGTGMVIGNLDTGMRWTHNALKPKYRGWDGVTADHNFNWHDAIHSASSSNPCGVDAPAPCDDNGHGTHTTGTIVGDDGAGNQVGVAPGAKWIGCRNMEQNVGTPATYTECFQFMIAPTDLSGNNANPALRPHVLNNSWGCPASEGCVTRAELEAIISNTQAAGIFVEASAGNSGPACATVSTVPAIYSDVFSVGAIDINNALAGFSSRGPSTYYNPNLLKPNLSAPGVNVRSATRTSDSSFGNLSGTSMAAPHVAGVVALLWCARPQLARDIAATKSILESTANPNVIVAAQTCGGTSSTQIPNNSFGYGRIDALAAVNGVPQTTALGNISTRIRVEAGDDALIGGFIVSGTQTKKVVIRAIGPSLGLTDQLANPILELRDSSGTLLEQNDNWIDSPNRQAIIDSGLAPKNDLESAIIANLVANNSAYTGVVRGAAGGTGIGVVEVYDLNISPDSKLANTSTRGLVQTGDNVLFAGMIVVGPSSQQVVIRAIGPSLSIAGKLADPFLELRDSNGALVQASDNWVDSVNKQAILDSGLAPTDDLESAILATLSGNRAAYTAIVRGANNKTGIAVLEVYALN
jgi:subtilisin family serine protease